MLQLKPCLTQAEALTKGLESCRQAQREGAEIVLFPEMWNIGYAFPESEEGVAKWERGAISADSPFVEAFRQLAGERQLIIAVTLSRSPPTPAPEYGAGNRQTGSGRAEVF